MVTYSENFHERRLKTFILQFTLENKSFMTKLNRDNIIHDIGTYVRKLMS